MKTTKWARLTLMAVVMLVTGAFTVVACAPPAAPEQVGSAGDVPERVSVPATEVPFVLQQSEDGDAHEDPTVEPTPTATRDPDCFEVHHPNEDRMVTMRPPHGPKSVEPQLRQDYNAHMEEKADGRALGELVKPVMIEVVMATSM